VGLIPPSRDALERLDLFGRIVNGVGVPLIMCLFIAVYFGWVTSPLDEKVRKNGQTLDHVLEMLNNHDRVDAMNATAQLQETTRLNETLSRLLSVLKMVDCADIADRTLRERCLNR
jgi:hypothetical protein